MGQYAGARLNSGSVRGFTGTTRVQLDMNLGKGRRRNYKWKGWGQGQLWCGQEGACGPSLRRPFCQQGRAGKGPSLREVWLDVRLLGGSVGRRKGRCRVLAGQWSPGSWYFA